MVGLTGCLGSDDESADDSGDEAELGDDALDGLYHVATDGDDSNNGTASEPLASIDEGLQRAHPGDTIYVQPGEYFELGPDERPLTTVRPGEPDAPITLTGSADAIFRPSFQIIHDHFRLEGLTFEGLVDPDNRDDPDSYYGHGGPIDIRPAYDTHDYVKDVVCAPHGVGFGAHGLIGISRAKYVEIGPLKVTGLAGASWILPQEPDRHSGEIVYVGSPLTAVFDWVGPVVEDFPWPDELDQTNHLHIHHIDNSEGHPHSNLVDVKPGAHDVLVEYCTDAGGSQNTEPYPADAVPLRSYDVTVRYCDLRNGEGNAIHIAGTGTRVLKELDDPPVAPERIGTDNAVYGNFVKGFAHQDLVFFRAHPDDQMQICDNTFFAPNLPEATDQCPAEASRQIRIGHAGTPIPDLEIPRFHELAFEFNRAPLATEINPRAEDERYVAFMCYWLSFLDDGMEVVLDLDVGSYSPAIIWGEGYYTSVVHNGETSRFFGGPDRRTTMYFHAKQLRDAHYLQVRGWPVDDDISAYIYFDGEHVDHVEFIGGMNTYEVSLAN